MRWHLDRRREAAEAPVGGDPPLQASYMGYYTMSGGCMGCVTGYGIVRGELGEHADIGDVPGV